MTLSEIRKCFAYYFLNTLAGSNLCPMGIRSRIYRLFGHNAKIVFSECFLGIGKGKLIVGNNSYCNHRCFFDLSNDIIIGNNCSIAYGVTFVNSTHDIGTPGQRAGGGENAPIVVEDGSWIGANVTIMPGVVIAKGCVIAAGSLVLKSTEPDGLYAGVPARRKKNLV